jgi:hypothetical protein
MGTGFAFKVSSKIGIEILVCACLDLGNPSMVDLRDVEAESTVYLHAFDFDRKLLFACLLHHVLDLPALQDSHGFFF